MQNWPLSIGVAAIFAVSSAVTFYVFFSDGRFLPEAASPIETLRGERTTLAIFVLGVGGMVAIVTAISALIRGSAGDEVIGYVILGLVSGLAIAINYRQGVAWMLFVATRISLGIRGQFPVRIMRFLDDAHRRGVLRQIGGSISFGTPDCVVISNGSIRSIPAVASFPIIGLPPHLRAILRYDMPAHGAEQILRK